MKKLILSLMVLIPMIGLAQVKNAGCYLRMTTPQSDDLSFENDSLAISFEFNSLNYFCGLSVRNKMDEVIQVDWDKFIMVMEGESIPILFDDTRMINKNEKKGKTPIAPGTSISKNIAPTDYIELDMPLYNKGWVKKRGDQEIRYLIPIDFNNDVKYYTCVISISLK